MKKITAAVFLILFCASETVFPKALVNASLTGRIYGNIRREHGVIVRFTLRDNGWPNALRDVVIRASTHIYRNGHPGERLSPNALYRGEGVRVQGGMTTFFNRIVADRIIVLH